MKSLFLALLFMGLFWGNASAHTSDVDCSCNPTRNVIEGTNETLLIDQCAGQGKVYMQSCAEGRCVTQSPTGFKSYNCAGNPIEHRVPPPPYFDG